MSNPIFLSRQQFEGDFVPAFGSMLAVRLSSPMNSEKKLQNRAAEALGWRGGIKSLSAAWERHGDNAQLMGAPLLRHIKETTESLARAVDDASSVVDAGEDEAVAYENEIEAAKQLSLLLENIPTTIKEPSAGIIFYYYADNDSDSCSEANQDFYLDEYNDPYSLQDEPCTENLDEITLCCAGGAEYRMSGSDYKANRDSGNLDRLIRLAALDCLDEFIFDHIAICN